jgi:hypothetical protein
VPATVSGLADAVAVAGGAGHTCAVRQTGESACWGAGTCGQLGNGDIVDSCARAARSGLVDATAAAAGASHTCAVRATGEIVCWGGRQRSARQRRNERARPYRDRAGPGGPGAGGARRGVYHTCAIRDARERPLLGLCYYGQLGDGTIGQLGRGNANIYASPRPWRSWGWVTRGGHRGWRLFTRALRATGEVVCWGYGMTPANSATAASGSSTLVPVSGLGDTTRWLRAATHACAVRATGEVVCWGYNGATASSATAARPPPRRRCRIRSAMRRGYRRVSGTRALRATGEVVCWGGRQRPARQRRHCPTPPTPLPVIGLVDAVACQRAATTCRVRATGEVVCWGLGFNGQLGNGASCQRRTPVRVGLGDAKSVSPAGFMRVLCVQPVRWFAGATTDSAS